jgi:hypothetical protein
MTDFIWDRGQMRGEEEINPLPLALGWKAHKNHTKIHY